jgi:tetratricopeptide (TPR) repeat protein
LRCGFRRYLEIWQSNREKVVGWARPEITGYHHAVAATWQTSVDQLSEAGRHLLERLAFFAPDPVPMFLLDVPVPQQATVKRRAFLVLGWRPHVKTEDPHDALADLATVSLVTQQAEREQFAVHRLVQDVTRHSLDPATSCQRVAEALGWVNAAFIGDPQDIHNWPTLDPIAPHALTVSHWADEVGIVRPTSELMSNLGLLLNIKSLHAQAEPLYRRALAIDEASSGPDHPDVAIRVNNLAVLLQFTDRLAEAEPLFRRALAIDEACFGPANPTVAIRLNNLAQLLRATNRLAEAELLMRRALTIDEASFPPDHPTIATRLNNLALLLLDTNRLINAELLIRRALAIDEKSFGPDDPNVAIDLNNLAGLLRATNRPAEAERLYRRASAIAETSFGPNHPTVASFLSNISLLLQTTKRLTEAESLARRALAIFIDFERKNGHPHPDCQMIRDRFAGLLAEMGKSEAEIEAAIAEMTAGST